MVILRENARRQYRKHRQYGNFAYKTVLTRKVPIVLKIIIQIQTFRTNIAFFIIIFMSQKLFHCPGLTKKKRTIFPSMKQISFHSTRYNFVLSNLKVYNV
jgi:hypothetical protein